MKTLSRRIFLEDFEIVVSIGIHEVELTAPQRVLVNIELDLVPDTPPTQDLIGEVLDYDFLRERIQVMIFERHFQLQETLCHEIAAMCAACPGVVRVRISTRKPDVYSDCRSVGYEVVAEP